MSTSTFYYREPRLEMTVAGRFIIRLVSYFSYGIIAALGVIFALSDLHPVRAAGILICLFLLDRVFHLGKPERALAWVSSGPKNIKSYLEPEAYRLIEKAFDRAAFSGGDFPLHLMAALVKRSEIRRGLQRMDIKSEELTMKIDEYARAVKDQKINKDSRLAQVNQIALTAFTKAQSHYELGVGPEDLFSALAEYSEEPVAKLFRLFEINANDLTSALIFAKQPGRRLTSFFSRPFKVRHRVMNRAWTARPTPILDRYSTDLTDLARAGESGFLVGHEAEYERLLNVLSRPGNPNALLIGEPGAGKETLVSHLAFQMIHDRVPQPLFDRRLVSLSVGSLVAGADPGAVEDRVKQVLNEIILAGNIVLYIPDIHNLIKTSGELRLSAADILIPAIQGTQFSVIGATYPQEFKKWIEPNTDFANTFEQIQVQEISEDQAVQYLVYESLILESGGKTTISFGSVKMAVRLAHKYFRQKLLPSSAEDLLKEALAAAISHGKEVLTAEDVINIAEHKVNIPMRAAKGEEASELLKLEETIHQKYIDQNEAVSAVSQALREYRSGLSRKGGPIATFLFVGPTGVGKTELSKMLAEIQFGSRELMIRFDMSEYQDKQSFFRFIGAPDGSTRGALTEAILAKPYSLILLDEFEKAHPDILNLFLQVFDDGRLTDNLGRTVDFQNTLIIATSNAHSTLIKEEIEKGTQMKEVAEMIKKKLTDYFKPELINRFTDIIVFKNLSPEDTLAIAKLNLAELSKTMQETHSVDLIFTDGAAQAVATLGYDPVFGARPLRNVINEKLRSVLAEKILKNEITRGGKVVVSFDGQAFSFNTTNQ